MKIKKKKYVTKTFAHQSFYSFIKKNLNAFKGKIFFCIVLTFVIIFLVIILICLKLKERNTECEKNPLLICPKRGIVGTRKYDSSGCYTEEYLRIKLIKYLIKRGIDKKRIETSYKIRIGHKGKNFLIPDIVVLSKKEGIGLVAEVKKSSSHILSAIEHQLIPAMKLLNCKTGIYYDGTKNSKILKTNKDGKIIYYSLSI